MSKHTDEMVALAQPALAPGEEVISAVRVNYNGTITANTFSTDHSIAGLESGEEPAAVDPAVLVSFPTASQMGLVLTGGRIFVWGLGMSGKAKGWLGEVPLSAIESVSEGAGQLGAKMRISLMSGAAVDFEALRGEDADVFARHLAALVAH